MTCCPCDFDDFCRFRGNGADDSDDSRFRYHGSVSISVSPLYGENFDLFQNCQTGVELSSPFRLCS